MPSPNQVCRVLRRPTGQEIEKHARTRGTFEIKIEFLRHGVPHFLEGWQRDVGILSIPTEEMLWARWTFEFHAVTQREFKGSVLAWNLTAAHTLPDEKYVLVLGSEHDGLLMTVATALELNY